MRRRFYILLFALFFISPSTAYCLEKVRVFVPPFEINAGQERAGLKDEIPEALSKQLQEAGAAIAELPEDMPRPEQVGSVEQARELGTLAGADHVVWGPG